MIEHFINSNPIGQAFVATCFTWLATAAGAAIVLVYKRVSRKPLDVALGFAGGVMIAASFWSLLNPAIQMSAGLVSPIWLPSAIGFSAGGIFMRIVDKLLPHLHPGFSGRQVEGIKTSLKTNTLLMLAMTLHNIPEGLAVGVAFGAVAAKLPSATLAGAIAITIGIALQDIPEGVAISMPLRRGGMSRFKSFWYGQLSGVVEIIGGVIGAATAVLATSFLPYALSFAAGAMIYVVIEEVIPESQTSGNADIATLGTLFGFVLMMILDVGLG